MRLQGTTVTSYENSAPGLAQVSGPPAKSPGLSECPNIFEGIPAYSDLTATQYTVHSAYTGWVVFLALTL